MHSSKNGEKRNWCILVLLEMKVLVVVILCRCLLFLAFLPKEGRSLLIKKYWATLLWVSNEKKNIWVAKFCGIACCLLKHIHFLILPSPLPSAIYICCGSAVIPTVAKLSTTQLQKTLCPDLSHLASKCHSAVKNMKQQSFARRRHVSRCISKPTSCLWYFE